MKKILIISLLLIGFGYAHSGHSHGADDDYMGHGGYMGHMGCMGGSMRMNRASNHIYVLMRVLSRLDLTKTQRRKIRNIMIDYRIARLEQLKDIKPPKSIFDKNSNFNKSAFIKFSSRRAEKSIKLRADTISKVVSVLTKKQKDMIKNIHR